MRFCTIGSGSKGNMTYIETKKTKLLLDAGISLRDARTRTASDNLDFTGIDAVVITHEHIDHTKFLASVMKATHATLYINRLSFDRLDQTTRSKLDSVPIVFMEANRKYTVGDLEILTMKLLHDSANIFGFVFMENDRRLAYITDTGFFPIQYIDILKNVDAIIIESNHDVTMLMESNRSWYLKERILSAQGHMSNYICQQVLVNVLSDRQKVVVLAHISLECNTAEIIDHEVVQVLKRTYHGDIMLASQFEAMRLYEI